MKTASLAVAAVSLLQIVSAQPHRKKYPPRYPFISDKFPGRRHAHAVQHQNVKKEDVVVTIIDTVYAQATEVPEVWIYVDQEGNPVSTTTEYHHFAASEWSTAHGVGPTAAPVVSSSAEATSTSVPVVQDFPVAAAKSSSTTTIAVLEIPTSTAAPAPAPTSEAAPVVSSTSEAPVVVSITPVATTPIEAASPVATTSAPIVVVPSTSEAAPAPSSTSTGSTASGGSGFGVSYSPYNGDGTCKTQSQVDQDFAAISGYALIRIYGTDCNQVSTVLSAVKAKGWKLFAGVYDITNVNSEIANIVAAANNDWSSFETISIGNELVNNGGATVDAVVAAIGTARALLKSAGYTGNVVTVDTLVAARNNPVLCDASDFCAVNCHPFFDGGYVAADSGKFLTDMIPTLSAVLANKNQKIVITETGWPKQGESNKKAVPSQENQAAAVSAIKSTFASNPASIILFTAFNDMWKSNTAAQFEAEQYWGLGGNPPSG